MSPFPAAGLSDTVSNPAAEFTATLTAAVILIKLIVRRAICPPCTIRADKLLL